MIRLAFRKKIIRKYNLNNAEEEISKFLDYEQLTTNAWFDRRTALRELFGDVMVLQEARRLLRNPDLPSSSSESPNLETDSSELGILRFNEIFLRT